DYSPIVIGVTMGGFGLADLPQCRGVLLV
ncbi:hypothetical protein KIPB_014388, partial [Kipferlia bialata]